jgi:hypothetical protein
MIFCPAHRSTPQAARARLDFYLDSVYFDKMWNTKVDLHIDRSRADSWCAAAFFNSDSVSCFVYGMTNYRSHAAQIDLDDWWLRSFKFTDDRDDRPMVGASCRCLNLSTSIGGTHRIVYSGHRQIWNSKVCARTQDTRFIHVRVARVAYPTSCLE